MYSRLVFIVLLIFCINAVLSAQKYEDDYAMLIQEEIGGELEVAVQSGFVDLLTDRYAIEIEFARKWKQSIGQALWYGLQTNKMPGVILIKERKQDNRYVLQLGSTLNYAGLDQKIKMWIWPDDFKSGTAPKPDIRRRSNTPYKGKFWLTISSNKRHNSGCRYYEESSGKYCVKREGIPCDICGG